MSTRTRRVLAGAIEALVILTFSACSLLNDPDRSFLDGAVLEPVRDSGFDGGGRDGGRDGGGDAGDAGHDGGRDAGTPPELCTGGIDEDDDGLVDCADPDCASDLADCCGGESGAATSLDFTTMGPPPGLWADYPTGMSLGARRDGTGIVSIGAVGQTGATMTRDCQPLGRGASIIVTLGRRTDCPAPGCDPDGTMGITLTRARQLVDPSSTLPAELRVAIDSGGHIVVSQASRVISTSPALDPGTPAVVTIELGPSATPLGRAGLRVHMAADIFGDLTGERPVYIESLVPDCVSTDMLVHAPGLYVALEGRPAPATIPNLRMARSACDNPTLWSTSADERPADAELGTWTTGGLGDVGWALLPGPGGHWEMLVDATPRDPDTEGLLYVPWAVALLTKTTLAGDRFVAPNDRMTRFVAAALGTTPTGCDGASCTPISSAREAEGIVVGGTNLYVAYACEAGDPRVGTYDICTASYDVTTQPAHELMRQSSPWIVAGDVTCPSGPCVSLRGPAIAHPETTACAWRVFFVAEDLTGDTSLMTGCTSGSPGTAFSPIMGFSTVVDQAALGSLATRAIGAVTVASDGPSHRLWFLTETPLETTISTALVTENEDGSVATALYGANPVVRAAFGGLTCTSPPCRVRGVSVLRASDAGGPTYHMVVSYDDPGATPRSRLRHLTQQVGHP